MPSTTTVQEAYEAIRAYFSRPEAVLAKYLDEFKQVNCNYRTPEGNKCAVGCLISDELYDKLTDESDFRLDQDFGRVEGVKVGLQTRFERGENGNLKELAGIIGYDDPERFKFLSEAQSAHDQNAETAPHFIVLLDHLAKDHGLQVVTR